MTKQRRSARQIGYPEPRPDNPLANRLGEGVGDGGLRSGSDVRNATETVGGSPQRTTDLGKVTETVHRLSLLTYKQIEQRMFIYVPTSETTGIQAGYQLGLQHALKILREFTVGL